MFVRVVAPETKFAVGPLAQAGGWGPWHARGTGSGKHYIFVDEGYEQRFFSRRHQLFAVLQRALGSKSCRAQPSFPWIRPAGRHMREDTSCKKQVLFCFVWLATLGLPVLASRTAASTFRRVVEAP